ncbi:polysaccharide lyase family 8 super-sandwich domain-containing protein [Mucilaginibacter aquatilis]|uniref:Chondroitin AC lyase n=1 Tax=Mucilaginibacter aquatilis TaxID=1517760 RepID=A0A6I4IA01_9SPHI|nr:polysaccharide lyase family 8 super-sandwich domain-containing protein [Mucilaginibacter aquatilis]MVN91817.1 chondroitin AC lyase [Mucilaginibacter aquatilis]
MYKKGQLLALIVLFCVIASKSTAQEADTILNRYGRYLLSTSNNKVAGLPNIIASWPKLVNGQWPDVDYADRERGQWKTLTHLRRVNDMVLAWANPASTLYRNGVLWANLSQALQNWTDHKYINPNWWHNEVGVPQLMRNIIVLTRGKLQPALYNDALTVLAQTKLHEDATGGNMIWCADLVLHRAALTGNYELMKRSRDLIVNEVKITTGDGIQPDFSFHQHYARLQIYEYGRAMFFESIRLAWQFMETDMAYPADKLEILKQFAINGWQWMARHTITVPGTIDRAVVRKNELRNADIQPWLPFLKQLFPQSVGIHELEQHQQGKLTLNGFRYFPYSDFAVYHQPKFSAFLKTLSTRTYPTESINNENLLGGLLGGGDMYYVRTGNEYFNLMPVWDWTAIPGITTLKGAAVIERKKFNGSVGSSTSGFSAMDFAIKNKAESQKLEARKFWAFHQGLVVSLIAEVDRTNVTDTIFTVVDQSRLQSKVYMNNSKQPLYQRSGYHNGAKLLHHNKLAYYFAQPTQLYLKQGEVTGSWKRIDGGASDAKVTDSTMLAKIVHAPAKSVNTAFAVGYCENAKTLSKSKEFEKAFKIIANNADCQIIQFSDGLVMAAFYKASAVKINTVQMLEVSKPCLVMINNRQFYASDPTHTGGTLQINYGNRRVSLQLPDNGTTGTANLN